MLSLALRAESADTYKKVRLVGRHLTTILLPKESNKALETTGEVLEISLTPDSKGRYLASTENSTCFRHFPKPRALTQERVR